MTTTLKSTSKITKAVGNRLSMEKRFVTSPSSAIQPKPLIVSHRAIVGGSSKDKESQEKPLVIVKNRVLADGDHEGTKSVMYLQRSSGEGADTEKIVKIVKNRSLVVDGESRKIDSKRPHVLVSQQRPSKQLILTQGSDQVIRQDRSPKYIVQVPSERSDELYYEYLTDE